MTGRRRVGGREADEARALHVITGLLDDCPGIDAPVIVSQLGEMFGGNLDHTMEMSRALDGGFRVSINVATSP
ncbi:hypothetical protein GCM10009610_04260 [Pseudonocardia xinjiangensis]